eukprot:2507602-Ditylum_brightwellii.AAC.1
MLALTGEGGSKLGPPHPLILESKITTTRNTICSQAPVFEGKVSASTSWPMFQASTIMDQTSLIIQIAPIPTFFVYDGLEKDLDATTILARIEDLEHTDKVYMVHCCAFLRAAMVKYCKNNADIAPPVEVFMTMPGTKARSWTAALICKLLRVDNTTPPKPPTKSTSNPCAEGDHDVLPVWFKQVAKKGTSNNTKNKAILCALQNIIYDDAELGTTAQLLTTIWKRKWLSDQPVVTFSTTSKGLSPFAVPEMTEDLIGNMNMKVESLEAATSTTAKEIHKVMTVRPKIEPNMAEFMLQLKRYVNLCFRLFRSSSPAYLQMQQVIKALMSLKAGACSGLSGRAKTSIMWIVLLQARHIAAGNLTVLAEFQTMPTMLLAKNTAIFHAKVLAALIPQKATNPPIVDPQEHRDVRK